MDDVDSALDAMEAAFLPFLSSPLAPVVASLSPFDSASLHTKLATCAAALAGAHARLGGGDLNAHGIAAEMARLRTLTARIEAARGDSEQRAMGAPSRVDKGAAKRLVAGALGSERTQKEGGNGAIYIVGGGIKFDDDAEVGVDDGDAILKGGEESEWQLAGGARKGKKARRSRN